MLQRPLQTHPSSTDKLPQVRVWPELGLLQLPLSVHIVYLPEKPRPVPSEGTRGRHRPPLAVSAPAPWWAQPLS